MPTTKAQRKAVNDYIRRHYDRIGVTVPQGMKAQIERRAYERGYTSINAYLCDLIRNDMSMSAEEWKKAGE